MLQETEASVSIINARCCSPPGGLSSLTEGAGPCSTSAASTMACTKHRQLGSSQEGFEQWPHDCSA